MDLKVGFSEKATKFEKIRRRTFDKSVVFCARNSVLVKKSTKIFFKNVDKSYYTNFKTLLPDLQCRDSMLRSRVTSSTAS